MSDTSGFGSPADVERLLAEAAAAANSGAPAQIPPPAEPPGGQPPAPPAGTPEPTPPGMLALPDGTVIALERLESLAQLDHQFQASPETERAVREVIGRRGMFGPGPGTPAPPPPGWTPPVAAPPAPAPWQPVSPPAPAGPYSPYPAPPPPPSPYATPSQLDQSDPVVAWVQAQTAALASQQAQMQQILSAQQAQYQTTQDQAAASGLERARADMRQRYPTLSFDELAQVEATAANRGYGMAFMNRYGDAHRAALEAMEVAGLQMPELRSKMLAPAPTNAGDTARRQALSALAGGGGAAPRNEPVPRTMTEPERRAAMAEEIARMTQANT